MDHMQNIIMLHIFKEMKEWGHENIWVFQKLPCFGYDKGWKTRKWGYRIWRIEWKDLKYTLPIQGDKVRNNGAGGEVIFVKMSPKNFARLIKDTNF